jgi:hypothetical protein
LLYELEIAIEKVPKPGSADWVPPWLADRLFRAAVRFAAGATILLGTIRPGLATDQVHDEIQVYNAEIADVGQWTLEQHLNYAAVGQTQPGIPRRIHIEP